MTPPTVGRLAAVPALDRTDLLAPVVADALSAWDHGGEVGVVEIDPELADTAAMTEAYDVPLNASANCVVVSGRRAGEERLAACLVRADTRADVNNLVKRTLDVRKASFHPMERAVEETSMEYGGITPVGLPDGVRSARGPGRARHRRRDRRQWPAPLQAAAPGPARRRAARRGGAGWARSLNRAHERHLPGYGACFRDEEDP